MRSRIWDGRGNVYLVDALTYALLYDSRGEQTAREIVENLLTQFVERLPENDNMRVAFEKNPEEMTEDDKDIVYGSIGSMYAQLALLRRLGLLARLPPGIRDPPCRCQGLPAATYSCSPKLFSLHAKTIGLDSSRVEGAKWFGSHASRARDQHKG